MSAIKALSIWRNADHEDTIVLSRNEVVALLEEIRASNKELLEALKLFVTSHDYYNGMLFGGAMNKARAAIKATEA